MSNANFQTKLSTPMNEELNMGILTKVQNKKKVVKRNLELETFNPHEDCLTGE